MPASSFRVLSPRLKRMRLFCFPYAGASHCVFRDWTSELRDVEVCAYEPPGRGIRITESLISNIDDLTSDAVASMESLLDKAYIVFGHSMGALLAFTVVSRLAAAGHRPPQALVLSASTPRPRLMPVSEDGVLDRVRSLAAVPPDTLRNPDFIEMFLPILRADFSVCRSFAPDGRKALHGKVFLCGGASDSEISVDELEEWNALVRGSADLRIFEGGHFFPWTDRLEFFDHLRQIITGVIPCNSQMANRSAEGQK